MNVEMCATERSLLGLLVARIHQLDPDVFVVSELLSCIISSISC